LLSRYTSSQDISVGLPIAGRNRVESEGLVGLFLNTLVLRTEWTGNPTFRELLARVREVALGAYAHQELPFEKLVEELQPERDLSRTPLFQVMLVLQNAPLQMPPLTELEVGTLEVATRSTNYDLTVSITETEAGLQVLLDYNALLFREARMQRLLRHWERLLQSVVAAPTSKLSELQWLTDEEREQIVYGWNQTERKYNAALSVVDLIAQQRPEAVAVVSGAEQLTYGELNERANEVAHYLRSLGVGPETVVGVCLERTVELPIALLGVLKSGGAYLPLDPTYPRERLRWILEDAGVQVVLSEGYSGTRINTDLKTTISSENLAYVIYTSGSTGRPKGVGVTHGNLVNFLLSMQKEPGVTAEDTLLAVTTLAFDIAGLELYLPLISGGRLVLASREAATDGQPLLKLLREYEATVMQATPATWRLLLDALVGEGAARAATEGRPYKGSLCAFSFYRSCA
jgi:non-ribosomal peptide synthetase component F